MQTYKGIKREDAPCIFNFIDTYHNLAKDNYKDFLDSDNELQTLIKKHHFKKKLYITLYNLTPYFIIGILYAINT